MGLELLAVGFATRYDPGVMAVVLSNRGYPQVNAVAMTDCALLGEYVWVEVDGVVWGPYLVGDCAQTNHRRERLAVDLSWPLAVKFGVVDDVKHGVRVWSNHPKHPIQ